MIPSSDEMRIDVLTEEQRRRCMLANKGRNTKPELKLRKKLWDMGYRYRIGHNLPGKPDIVIVSRRLAIFVDGCFWHQCPEHFRIPKTNHEFWTTKIARNVARDAIVNEQLTAAGWKVIRIWEHELKSCFDATVNKIIRYLTTPE